MFCPKCGTQNNEEDIYCLQCGHRLPESTPASAYRSSGPPPPPGFGAAGSSQTSVAHPESHLLKAILVTLFCCLPLGIASIVYAAKVDGAWERGNHAEAVQYAEKANNFANWSIGIGLVFGIFYFLIAVGAGL